LITMTMIEKQFRDFFELRIPRHSHSKTEKHLYCQVIFETFGPPHFPSLRFIIVLLFRHADLAALLVSCFHSR
jgi:hypothetical protein